MTQRCYVGLDLGQARDYSALAVLRPWPSAANADRVVPVYDVPHLQRLPLGLPYPSLVESVAALLDTPALRGSVLVVDRTGIGRAVADMLMGSLCAGGGRAVIPVTITSGGALSKPTLAVYGCRKKSW